MNRRTTTSTLMALMTTKKQCLFATDAISNLMGKSNPIGLKWLDLAATPLGPLLRPAPQTLAPGKKTASTLLTSCLTLEYYCSIDMRAQTQSGEESVLYHDHPTTCFLSHTSMWILLIQLSILHWCLSIYKYSYMLLYLPHTSPIDHDDVWLIDLNKTEWMRQVNFLLYFCHL